MNEKPIVKVQNINYLDTVDHVWQATNKAADEYLPKTKHWWVRAILLTAVFQLCS